MPPSHTNKNDSHSDRTERAEQIEDLMRKALGIADDDVEFELVAIKLAEAMDELIRIKPDL